MVTKPAKFKTDISSPDRRFRDHISTGTFGGPGKVEAMYGGYRTIGSIGYNGEKNYGEIGPIKDYYLDYEALRARSWQLYLESEIAQIVVNNHVSWVIGNGLKLQSEPLKDYIEMEVGRFDAQEFSKSVESQFRLYCDSRMSDYADMMPLSMMEAEAFKNTIIGGDVLTVLRFVDGILKVELIDGAHVQSPVYGSEYFPLELQNGNRIINGIEINDRKQHVAYYVRKNYLTLEYERIPARASDGQTLMAYMTYGKRYRIDNYRGMSILAVMLETAKQLDRYKSATLGSAEERQKIAYAIEHEIFSTGESPLTKHTVKARDLDFNMENGFIPRDDFGNQLADKIATSTLKQTYNMPLGAKLKNIESKNELYFKDFYGTNLMLFCAACGIPYEVAMSKYDSNYSASRGAYKDWEHKLNVSRNNHSTQWKKPIYEFWLEVRILQKKIYAPGYIMGRFENDRMLLEAYRKCRFVGTPVPHIDPEKEVKAERLKLGDAGTSIPLTTVEAATEALGGGDSEANIDQFAEELKRTKSLGIKPEPVPAQGNTGKKPAKKA